MEGLTRKPLQGIRNIIRFNWHYYLFALLVILLLTISSRFLPTGTWKIGLLAAAFAFISILVSLFVSWYIYDRSNLYKLDWLDSLNIGDGKTLVNINAGFDETSASLKEKYPGCALVVFDFYDPSKHTEVSIKRARKSYPPYPGTITITTNNIPLKDGSADFIFLILAAHEIRNDKERILFFAQLAKALTPEGKIIVAEHQRDIKNFIAYTIGFFHFFSRRSWEKNFAKAGLDKRSVFTITPFINVFILSK